MPPIPLDQPKGPLPRASALVPMKRINPAPASTATATNIRRSVLLMVISLLMCIEVILSCLYVAAHLIELLFRNLTARITLLEDLCRRLERACVLGGSIRGGIICPSRKDPA